MCTLLDGACMRRLHTVRRPLAGRRMCVWDDHVCTCLTKGHSFHRRPQQWSSGAACRVRSAVRTHAHGTCTSSYPGGTQHSGVASRVPQPSPAFVFCAVISPHTSHCLHATRHFCVSWSLPWCVRMALSSASWPTRSCPSALSPTLMPQTSR